ncbi:MAG: CPBP family intramembrane glutamic endopeptidase [Nocardioidaceae bacterium]
MSSPAAWGPRLQPPSPVGTAPAERFSYHRTLSGKSAAPGRLVATLVLSTVGLFVVTLAALLVVVGAARVLGDGGFSVDLGNGVDAGEMLALNLGLAALVPLSGAIVWGVWRTRPRWLSSTRPGLRWRWLGASAGVAAVVWAPLLLLATAAAAVDRKGGIGTGVVAFVAVVLVTTPLQAAGEEYLFRGLVLQSLGAVRLPTWLCCATSGALFATAHLQFAPPLFADRFVLGCVLAAIAARTGGIEAGIAIHAVKNIAVLVPAGLLDRTDAALDPTGVSWLPLVVDVVLLSIATPWLLRLARRRGDLA